MRDRVELVRYAIRRGLIEPQPRLIRARARAMIQAETASAKGAAAGRISAFRVASLHFDPLYGA
jgi:hypothetical protein